MPTYRTTRVALNARVDVTCELCDHQFELYDPVQRSVSAKTTDGVQKAAEEYIEGVLQRLQEGIYDDIRVQKCPECGYIQSWMVPRAKSGRYMKIIGVGLGILFIAFFIPFVILTLQGKSILLPILWSVAGFFVVLGLAYVFTKNYDPNAKVLGNREVPEPKPPKIVPLTSSE